MSIRDYLQRKKLDRLKKEDPTGYVEQALSDFLDLYDRSFDQIQEELTAIKLHSSSVVNMLDTKVAEIKSQLTEYVTQKTEEALTKSIAYIDEYLKAHPAEKGDKGDSYLLTDKDKEEIAKSITVPVVDKVIEKHYSTVESKQESPIIIEASKETGETIAQKLNETKESVAVSVIRGLQEELESIKRTIRRSKQISGGGSSTTSGSVTVETPVGLVNASNTVYTVTAEPKFVVADNATYFNGAGYTYNALQITMDIPPSSSIRAII
jgi:hypothetical protein